MNAPVNPSNTSSQQPTDPHQPQTTNAVTVVIYDESMSKRFSKEATTYLLQEVDDQNLTATLKHRNQRKRLADCLNVPEDRVRNFIANHQVKKKKLIEATESTLNSAIAVAAEPEPVASDAAETSSALQANNLAHKKTHITNGFLEFRNEKMQEASK
ncbi:UNVERIFIED_CONTAM: hypothetical protein HDU68_009083 [Siphonaria sp. JEL0065]|nr:hypothetical protein HDU68_009083 [Siphonaria sp. JEL0065]